MSKKKMKELEKERVNFIYGNEELGIDGAIQARRARSSCGKFCLTRSWILQTMSFNKAHAVCYAVVSFRTAYLKCHLPERISGGAADERSGCFGQDLRVYSGGA